MKKWLLRTAYALAVLAPLAASADYLATPGGSATVFSFVCSSTKICPAFVLIDSTNVEKGTTGNPIKVDPTGTTPQPVTAGSLPLPTGAATSALQTTGNTALTTINTTLGTPFQAGGSIANTSFAATQSGAWTVNPTTAANWGVGTSTQNSASVANGHMMLGQFNTSPTTITTGNMSPVQLDNAGNLLVNIKAGASSGAVAQGSTTSGQTGSLVQCATLTSAPTYTTATTNPVSCDTAGAVRVNVTSALGLAQGVAFSSQTGSAIMGLASTNAPTATAGDMWMMSISPASGGVRVDLKDTPTNTNPFKVINGGSTYQAVAASQTATVLQTSTGAIGDYLSHCVVYPTSTSPGVVTVFDNTNAAGTSAILFPGGASSLSNLAPIPLPVGAVSTAGAWKVTTGANVSVVCYGKFS